MTPATSTDVTLRPMSADEYAAWIDEAVRAYADDAVRSTGITVDAALVAARADVARLLPDGRDTVGMTFFTVLTSERPIGILWVGPSSRDPGAGYVFDILIEEAERGRGLGRATMIAAETFLHGQGYDRIGLNVFGFNEPARRLYDSLGYSVVSTQMTKALGPA